MANQEAKQLLQEEVLQAFINTTLSRKPYCLTLHSSTGSGKTKAALECAKWFYNTVRKGHMFFGVHSELSRDHTIPIEMDTWLGDHPLRIDNTLMCYDSFAKVTDRDFAIGIFDEFHYITARSSGIFKKNKFHCIILLTAIRPRRSFKAKMIDQLTGDNVFKLSVDEGVNRGVTNDYRLHLYFTDLDNEVRYCSSPLEGKIDLYTEEECYKHYCRWIDDCKSWKNPGRIIQQRYATLQRWLSKTKTKMAIVRWMMDNLRKKDRRFIVFTNSKEQCPELSPHYMHSDIDDSEFQRFCRKEINELVCIDQVREGANIEDMTHGIIQQVNSDPLPLVQRNGRLLRLEADQVSSLFIPIFTGTYDDIWITKATREFDRKKIIKHKMDKSIIKQYWK